MEEKDDQINELFNYEGVCITALDTPINFKRIFITLQIHFIMFPKVKQSPCGRMGKYAANLLFVNKKLYLETAMKR